MSLTTQQLTDLQAKVDALKAAAAAESDADHNVAVAQAELISAQTALATNTDTQARAVAATEASEKDLVAFVEALLNPPPASSSGV